MGEIVAADLPFKEQEITREQAIDYFQKRNEPYKVELAAGDPRGRAHHAALARRVHRPLPRRPLQVDRRDQGVQAALGRRRLLARRLEATRCSSASTAPPSPTKKRARRVPEAARGGREARPPQARQGARAASRSIRGRRARRSGCPRARSLYNTLADVHAPAAPRRGRLRRGQDAAALQPEAVGDVGPLAALRRQHVQGRVRGAGLRPQADELPVAHASSTAWSCTAIATCRCACTTQDVLHRNEASGTLVGPHPRAPVRAGRRAHLPAARSDRGGGDVAARARAPRLRRLRHRAARSSSRRATPKSSWATLEEWDEAEAGARGARSNKNDIAYRHRAGEAAFYGPKIDINVDRRARPQVAVRDHPARLPAPERFDLDVRRRGQRDASAGGDPPRHLRQLRALHRAC